MNAFLRDAPLPPLLPADVQQRADAELGAAWRRCEAALPEGWVGPILEPKYTYHGKIVVVDYQVAVRNDFLGGPPLGAVHRGDTAAAALRALAEALEARKEADAD